MSKGEFTFAADAQVPKLMREFERGPLRDHTPCRFDNAREQATALVQQRRESVAVRVRCGEAWALCALSTAVSALMISICNRTLRFALELRK